MNKRQFFLILAISLIGGVIGGFLSGKVLIDEEVFAQSKNKQKIIVANEFRVLDEEGNIQAQLRGVSDNASLQFQKIGKELLAKYDVSSDSPIPGGLYKEISNFKIVGGKITKRADIQPYAFLSKAGLTFFGETYETEISSYGLIISGHRPTAFSPFLHIGFPEFLKTTIAITEAPKKFPVIEFKDKEKQLRLSLSLRDDSGEPYIALMDNKWNSRAILGETTLTDKTGSTIIRPPSSLVLFDKDGHVVWSAP